METPEARSSTLELLSRLKAELPDEFDQAEVVGSWVWLEFNVAPEPRIRGKLKELGFHWNKTRRSWQHPCGLSRGRASYDPKGKYPVKSASALTLNDAPPARDLAKEYKVVALRECPLPESLRECDTPDKAADYWRLHVATNPYFDPERECFVVLLLNTRRKVKGHQLVTIGTMDTILMHPREVFRVAIVAAAAAIVLMHNLCVAAHKLCYVQLPLMCSWRSTALNSADGLWGKERYATS